ncbi:hypothetical protein BTM25_16980 [Actinomadura rubteroloni]|uniref:DoxX family protein n=1 Tax=Actinomadura rubteroloni TaxID=1926885 RepID=A0A2P4UQG0_9ACTN|nr:DoxX family protein [Actinomadura rubteroloni]POM27287.1 hypothetical protein BTM25_16980 [Actinomadura rubteroloni]
MFLLTVIFTLATAGVFLTAGLGKLQGVPRQVDLATHLGVPWDGYRLVGVAEILGAFGLLVGLWASWLGILVGFCLFVLMVGALVTHSRAEDSAARTAPAIVVGGVVLITLLLRVATH